MTKLEDWNGRPFYVQLNMNVKLEFPEGYGLHKADIKGPLTHEDGSRWHEITVHLFPLNAESTDFDLERKGDGLSFRVTIPFSEAYAKNIFDMCAKAAALATPEVRAKYFPEHC